MTFQVIPFLIYLAGNTVTLLHVFNLYNKKENRDKSPATAYCIVGLTWLAIYILLLK